MEEMNNMEVLVTEDYCEEGCSGKGLAKLALAGGAVIGGGVLLVKKVIPWGKAKWQAHKDKKAGIVTNVEVVDSEKEN